MNVFVLELGQVRNILQGLRKLREVEPDNVQKIDETICFLKSQMVGKLKQLEPFMRNKKWLQDEINYEEGSIERHAKCGMCNNSCRGKFCSPCWHLFLQEIHGEPGHECRKE